MSLRQYLINNLTNILPPTRCYAFKARCYRWAGIEIATTARLVSSISIWGNGHVLIGENSFLGHHVKLLSGTAPINIGKDVDIGPCTILVNGSHQIDMINGRTAGQGQSDSVTIEDGVWIGAGCIVLGGITIGRKTMVAAGSVVTKDVPPWSFVAGCPAIIKKKWSKAKQEWTNV